MKKLSATFILVLFGFSLAVFSQTVTNTRGKRLDSAPKNFQIFFAKFKNAVTKRDKKAVAEMTRFPFHYGFDAGDEGTMTRAQFAKRFADIFGASPRQFSPETNPLFYKDDKGHYIISTEDAAHLSFVKIGSGFKFASYIVEP